MADQWSLDQVKRACQQYDLQGPVLDIGAGSFYTWFKPVFQDRGLQYWALDQFSIEGIDIVATVPKDRLLRLDGGFKTVMLLSILEHTYVPVTVVKWAIKKLAIGGHLLISVPVVWEEHDYPIDFWRFMPQSIRWLTRELTLLELVQESPRLIERGQLFAVAEKR